MVNLHSYIMQISSKSVNTFFSSVNNKYYQPAHPTPSEAPEEGKFLVWVLPSLKISSDETNQNQKRIRNVPYSLYQINVAICTGQYIFETNICIKITYPLSFILIYSLTSYVVWLILHLNFFSFFFRSYTSFVTLVTSHAHLIRIRYWVPIWRLWIYVDSQDCPWSGTAY